jgi:hypothetical protein
MGTGGPVTLQVDKAAIFFEAKRNTCGVCFLDVLTCKPSGWWFGT